jgi:hypothetical protein
MPPPPPAADWTRAVSHSPVTPLPSPHPTAPETAATARHAHGQLCLPPSGPFRLLGQAARRPVRRHHKVHRRDCVRARSAVPRVIPRPDRPRLGGLPFAAFAAPLKSPCRPGAPVGAPAPHRSAPTYVSSDGHQDHRSPTHLAARTGPLLELPVRLGQCPLCSFVAARCGPPAPVAQAGEGASEGVAAEHVDGLVQLGPGGGCRGLRSALSRRPRAGRRRGSSMLAKSRRTSPRRAACSPIAVSR